MPPKCTDKYLLLNFSHPQVSVVNDRGAADKVGPPGGVDRVDGLGAAASGGKIDEIRGIAEVIGHVGPIDGRHRT